MRKNSKSIGIIFLVIFLSGCGGWRLTDKGFSSTTINSKNISSKSNNQSIEPAQETLSLRGVGVKSILLMKLFIVGFYLPAQIDSDKALNDDVPKDLSVIFYAKFSAHDFTNFTIDHMKPNLTLEEFNSLKSQLDQMEQLFPNISPGDKLALSYKPGVGTSVIHNGKIRGTIEGKLFSKAIYSTWIGQKPFDNLIKRQILGG